MLLGTTKLLVLPHLILLSWRFVHNICSANIHRRLICINHQKCFWHWVVLLYQVRYYVNIPWWFSYLVIQFYTLADCDVVTFGVWKFLLDLSLVRMKGYPRSPALYVVPLSLIADNIVCFMTPLLTSDSVRWYFYLWMLRFYFTFCRHVLLFLSWWYVVSLKFTVHWCFPLGSFVMWNMRSIVCSSSSIRIVSGYQ